MVEYDDKGDFVAVRCDKCGKHNPPTEDLMMNRGLVGLGWYCAGGKHVCPDCKEKTRG